MTATLAGLLLASVVIALAGIWTVETVRVGGAHYLELARHEIDRDAAHLLLVDLGQARVVLKDALTEPAGPARERGARSFDRHAEVVDRGFRIAIEQARGSEVIVALKSAEHTWHEFRNDARAELGPVGAAATKRSWQVYERRFSRFSEQVAAAAHSAGLRHREAERSSIELTSDMLRNLVLGSVALFVMVVLGAWRASLSITRPLRVLVEGCKEVAVGKLAQRVSFDRHDELGDLGRAFASMASDLERNMVSRDYLQAVFEAIPEPAWVTNAEGAFELVNAATLTALGYERDALVGAPVARVVDDASIALSSTTPTTLRTRAGGEVPVLLSHAPLGAADAGERKTVWVARDISDVRRAEEQLAASRTRLAQSEKMDALGRLAGGVAHDFNNILAAILSISELMREAPDLPDATREDADEIAASARRAARLTRQLLAFSRHHVVEPVIVDLNDLILETAKMLRRVIGEDIPLQVSVEPGPLKVRADVGQLQQVVLNLVVNARDAIAKKGSISIATGLEELDAETMNGFVMSASPGRYVALSVTDTGSGIRPDELKHIFEPFFTTKAAGTGIGLATVYGVVKQAGGALAVRSAVGAGSTFVAYFPACDPALAASASVRPESQAAGEAIGAVLLVEDEQAVRRATRRMLEALGHVVLEASCVDEARAIFDAKARDIRVLVTDIVMPTMNGPELAAELMARKPDLRVLFMSGYADGALDRAGGIPPGSAFLSKPFARAELADKLRRLCRSEDAASD